jgi:hypothetical protein
MKQNVGWVRTVGLGMAILAAMGQSAWAATEEHVEKTFTVSSGGKLVLDVNVGSLEVKGADRKDVHVEVNRKATTRGFFGANEEKERAELKANEVTFAQEGNTVIVKSKRDKNAPRNSDVNLNARYTVLVPRQFEADLKTAGGGIRVDDLTGELKAHTSGGGLKFANIKGPIDGHTSGGGIDLSGSEGTAVIKTSGGGINVHNHKGDLTAHTSGGGIDVDRVEGNVQASTSGGAVSATLAKTPTADCRLESSGGGITLRLPENAAVTVDAKTSGGSVQSDLPVKIAGAKKRDSLKGEINEGGKAVYLRTSGGNIHVKKI